MTALVNGALSVLGAISTLIGRFLKALWEDVADLFTSRRWALALAVLCLGGFLATVHYGDKIRELQKQLESTTEALEEERTLNKEWQARYDGEIKRAAEAEKAREAAAESIKQAAEQAAAEAAARRRAAIAKRVRTESGAGAKTGSAEPASSGLPGFSLSLPTWGSK